MSVQTKLYITSKNAHALSFAIVASAITSWFKERNATNQVFRDAPYFDESFNLRVFDQTLLARLPFSFTTGTFKPSLHLKNLNGLDPSLLNERVIEVGHYPYPIHDNDAQILAEMRANGVDDVLLNASEFIMVSITLDEFTLPMMVDIAHHLKQAANIAVYQVQADNKSHYVRIDRP